MFEDILGGDDNKVSSKSTEDLYEECPNCKSGDIGVDSSSGKITYLFCGTCGHRWPME